MIVATNTNLRVFDLIRTVLDSIDYHTRGYYTTDAVPLGLKTNITSSYYLKYSQNRLYLEQTKQNTNVQGKCKKVKIIIRYSRAQGTKT